MRAINRRNELEAKRRPPIFRDEREKDQPHEIRLNERIQAREVRLIDEQGEMLGVMSLARALQIARQRELDLVEVGPNGQPPVCKLMDYGHYQEQLKQAMQGE